MGRITRLFIEWGLLDAKIDEYLAQNFYGAGYSRVNISRTGLETRVYIFAERPALIIGRRGSTVKRLQETFQKVFSLENPRIQASIVEEPELDARVQAFRIARAIEIGYHFRRVAFAALNRIMSSGALGAEIKISGKLTSERARFEKYRAGKVYKAGHNVDVLVDRAVAHALLPKGVIGVEVIIAKPGKPGDYIRIKNPDEVADLVKELRERMAEERAEKAEEVSGGAEA
ncbi:30S ribosomal protein S3 [Stetteria hydrogenophila]